MASVFEVKINVPWIYILNVQFDCKKLCSFDYCDLSDFYSADFMLK